MKLSDKVAGVTGSVRGLGWEMVQAFAEEGAKVVICDLDQGDVDGAVARLALPPGRVLGLKANVTVEQDVLNLFQRIKEKFSRLDIWVNNAGFSWPPKRAGMLEVVDTPLEDWLQVLTTNLTGTFLCGREALKIMRVQRSGSIINITSNHGKEGRPRMGPYCASKFGIEGLTQVLALENSAHTIRVNALKPGGAVATERHRSNPLNKGKKALKPAVIRDCAVYLASDEAAGITGQSFTATEWNEQHGIEVKYIVE
ncbi:MAG: SDR family NAD(P)-dependent oxidoreductase [Candidatus Binatia bacterium]